MATTDMIHETGTFTSATGLALFCQQWLPAAGVTKGVLVLVHGVGEHSSRYMNLVNALVPAGYGIYAHDHQGFGRSEGARGHVNRFIDYAIDVKKRVGFVRGQHPGKPICLFSHSMGGLIGIQYLLEYQSSVDMAIISAPAVLAQTQAHLVALMRVMNVFKPTFVIQRPGGAEGISRDPAEVEKYANDPMWVRTSSARWAVEILKTQEMVRGRAGEITLPILMVQGGEDMLVVPEATTKFFNGIGSEDKTYHYYEEYYHELHNDVDKEKPLGDILAWLDARMGG